MKKLLLLLIVPLLSFSQQTYIPDDEFEEALIYYGYDDVLDDYVLTDNINTLNDLYLSYWDIQDLTGIEDFTELNILDISNNSLLTSLNGISNLPLVELYAYGNLSLTELDVSNNLELEVLWCGWSAINSIDVSNNPNLTYLNCAGDALGSPDFNNITEIDVSNNPNLTDLFCNNNLLTSLDVSSNVNLINLHCDFNNITDLDVTQNNNLVRLECTYNSMTSLLLSENAPLEYIVCAYNELTSLDVKSSALLGLWCYNNPLTSLDISDPNLDLFWLSCHDSFLSEIDVSNHLNLEALVARYTNVTTIDVSNNPVFYNLDVSFCPFLTSVDYRNGNNISECIDYFEMPSTCYIEINTSLSPNLSCISVDENFIEIANYQWANSFGGCCVDISTSSFTTEDCDVALGCTDDDACNFNSIATIDDGSCALENLDVDVNLLNISCHGKRDGEIQFDIIEGDYNISVELYQDDSILDSLIIEESGLYALDSLLDGTYDLVFIDSNGCSTFENNLIIIEPSPVITSDIVGDTIVNYFDLESYTVAQTLGSTYNWNLDGGGFIASGLSTSLINIQWSDVPGFYNLSIVETDSIGCSGDTLGVIVEVLYPSWECIQSACVESSDGGGLYLTMEDCEIACLNSSVSELYNTKMLIKVVDILGRETTNKGFQLHIYNDGSVEKKYIYTLK